MPGSLLDTNVWLAAVFATDPFHPAAQKNVQQATPAEPAVFCRATRGEQCAAPCTDPTPAGVVPAPASLRLRPLPLESFTTAGLESRWWVSIAAVHGEFKYE